MENKNVLTDADLNNVVDAAVEARESSEAANMEAIKEEVQVDINAELDQAEKVLDGDPADLAATTVDTMPAAEVSLFDIEGDQIANDNDTPELAEG